MANHKVYKSIVNAIRKGLLKEPFTSADFKNACQDLGDGTYNAFLAKHEENNPGGNSKLFKRVSRGKYKLLRPLKYGLH